MNNTRVKVPRLFLIEKIQEAIDKEIADYEADLKKYTADMLAIRASVTKEIGDLASVLAAFSDDEFIEYMQTRIHADRYADPACSYMYFTVKVPPRPHEPDTRYKEHSKRILEASTDETISVSSRDEYYNYL